MSELRGRLTSAAGLIGIIALFPFILAAYALFHLGEVLGRVVRQLDHLDPIPWLQVALLVVAAATVIILAMVQ